MIIRIATKSDSKRVATLHTESWRTTYRGMLPDDFLDGPVVEERLTFWQERLTSPPSKQLVLIAEEEDKLLGFICVLLKADDRWGTTIDNLHVRSDAKGKGIGTQLMKKATEWILSQTPNEGVWLWAYEKNEVARNYYKGLAGKEADTCLLPSAAGNSVMSVRYVWESPAQLSFPRPQVT